MTNTKNTAVAAGIAGAVLGAGMTAAATALSDRKTREKVMHTLNEVKNHAVDMVSHSQDTAQKVRVEAEDILNDTKRSVFKDSDEGDQTNKTL